MCFFKSEIPNPKSQIAVRSLTTTADLVALSFQVGHALEEIVSDPRPAVLDDEDQNRQGNRADDQDRLQTDGPSLVTMDLAQQPANRGESRHVSTPVT